MSSKKLLFLTLGIIILYINMTGCAKNTDNDSGNNYGDFVRAFAAETEPATEIISNTAVFTQAEETDEIKEVIETSTAEITEPTTTQPESTESTEPEKTISTELITTTESAQLYVITPSGKKYHRQTCRYAANVKQYVTKEEAEKLGYEPCKVCKP